jgi:lyso-ornithine lipid O-acyltransferase
MSGLALRLGRLALYLAVTLPAMPVQALFVWRKSRFAARFPRLYHRIICRILGIELELIGLISPAGATLFVANHTSYLDIEIMGAALEASFVAKAEVSGWPMFGWLAKLQRTIFITRADRAGTGRQRDEIRERLRAGDNLVLFPEGTSGDGIHLLPFKSALFAAADDECVTVQPISVVYRLLDGIPLGRFYRPFFAWYGDMSMAPHLWWVLGAGRLTVRLVFHEPVRLRDFGSRKALADHCARVIARGIADSLAGRQAAPADVATAHEAPIPALAAP